MRRSPLDSRRASTSVTLRWTVLAAAVLAFVVLVSQANWWTWFLGTLFPSETQLLHPRASLMTLVMQHVALVAVSSSLTIAVGVPLGIFVTRDAGKPFLSVTNDITALGQTFPPVAVLALAVPLTGFGFTPTILALFLYGLLPVVRNTIVGLLGVPQMVSDTARGVGMTDAQVLLRVELPLAARVILAGVRTSVVINVGTAMIGAVIGAGGLGSPIVAGLIQNNLAFVIEGALPAAMLALLLDQLIGGVETLVPGFTAPN